MIVRDKLTAAGFTPFEEDNNEYLVALRKDLGDGVEIVILSIDNELVGGAGRELSGTYHLYLFVDKIGIHQAAISPPKEEYIMHEVKAFTRSAIKELNNAIALAPRAVKSLSEFKWR